MVINRILQRVGMGLIAVSAMGSLMASEESFTQKMYNGASKMYSGASWLCSTAQSACQLTYQSSETMKSIGASVTGAAVGYYALRYPQNGLARTVVGAGLGYGAHELYKYWYGGLSAQIDGVKTEVVKVKADLLKAINNASSGVVKSILDKMKEYDNAAGIRHIEQSQDAQVKHEDLKKILQNQQFQLQLVQLVQLKLTIESVQSQGVQVSEGLMAAFNCLKMKLCYELRQNKINVRFLPQLQLLLG